MSLDRQPPVRATKFWWLTFLTCCAVMISPVVPVSGEEMGETADNQVMVVATPVETTAGTADGDVADQGEPLPGDPPSTDVSEAALEPVEVTVDESTGSDDADSDAPLGENPAGEENPGEEAASDPVQGPVVEQPQAIADIVEAEPQASLQLMSVEDAGLAPDTVEAIETLDAASDATTLASTLLPVGDTPENVVAVLVGSGVTYSNVGYTGGPGAIGTFAGGTGIIGFEDGIILSTGSVPGVVGPNDSSGTSGIADQPGDDDLSTLAGAPTVDAAVLTFDFVPAGNQIVFSYVFSSEEYNEYVNDGFNDVFAFYVNGENCAVVNGGAVSIDTINNDSNADLYIDNEDGHLNTEMDGLTVVLTCEATVIPGQTNTMKLAIADSGDSILDSNVFIQARSFVVPTPPPSPEPSVTPSPSTTPVTPEPSETPGTPDGTPTQPPGTPVPTEQAGTPQKPHTHYTSYTQYVEECEDPVPAVAFAVISQGGGAVTALPNTGAGMQEAGTSRALVVAAAIGAGVSLAGAIRTSRPARHA